MNNDFEDTRRACPRKPLMLRAEYSDGTDFLVGWTENISEGGLFVRTAAEFNEGENVTLRLSFPALLEELEITGKVAWRRPSTGGVPSGIGVQVHSESCRRKLASLAASVAQVPPNRAKPFSVLFIDDNAHMRRAGRRVLKRFAESQQSSVKFSFVENGHEGLGVLDEVDPDLVITDLIMPVMGGEAFIEAIRQNEKYRKVPVIVISGADAQARLANLKVDAILPKPLRFAELFESIVFLMCASEARAHLPKTPASSS